MHEETEAESSHLIDDEVGENPVAVVVQKAFSSRLIQTGAIGVLILILGFGGGYEVGAKSSGNSLLGALPVLGGGLDASPDASVDLTDFWRAYNVLHTKFVETHASSTIPDTQKIVQGAIAGLTSSYGDPYTVFFPPTEAKAFQDNIAGNFEGVGMEIGANKDGIITVIAPLKGTPADLAGIRSGDLIAAIDGKSTQGINSDAAVKLIRGKKGTTVDFSLVREGKPLDIKVVRDTINVPNSKDDYDAKTGIYTIALYEFTANSGSLIDSALERFRASGAKKLILDVRGDPGGYLDQAVDIASHFLPSGSIVVTEDYKGKQANIIHRSNGTGGIPDGTKVVVLIDQGSASASEILSGALQDNHAATLIGTRSFGKGSVQELIPIDGGSLKVTVARWLTPLGRSISDGGLTPDIKVERTQADYAAGKDPQMARAVQFLTTGS